MNKKRIILFPALALVLLCAPVCSNHFNTQTSVEAAAKVKLNARHKTILKGKKYQLKLKNNKKKIKWTSSNKKVATVNKKGKVTTKKVGKTTITAKVGRKKYICKITVENPRITDTSIKAYQGDGIPVYIDGTECSYKWKSSDSNVVKVSDDYDLVALNPGTCTVTTTVLGKTFSCRITVLEPFVTQDALKSLERSDIRTDHDVIAFLKNNYMYDLSVDIKCTFFDSNNKAIDVSETSTYVQAGTSSAALIWGPYDSEKEKNLNYSSYTISYSIDDLLNITELCNEKVNYTSKYGNDSILILTNTAEKRNLTADFMVIQYKDDKIIDVSETSSELWKTKSDTVKVYFPSEVKYDKYGNEDYETIIPDRYEIILKYARYAD